MATDNRRVATYLPPDLDEKFATFKSDNNIKGDSQALIQILCEYLGVSYQSSQGVAHYSKSSLIQRIEAVESRLNAIEDVPDVQGESPSSSVDEPHPDQLTIEDAVAKSESSGEISDELLSGLPLLLLEERLHVSRRTITRHKDKGADHFREWSAKRDPDKIAWECRDRTYYPSI